MALQALVECLGIWLTWLGLKVPILWNWVRLRPGIWDGATSSTGAMYWDMYWDKTSTWGCLGFAPVRGSKQCGIDILPMFQLRLGSSLLICIASFASQVTWEESLSIMVKLLMEGCGWWWSIQCFRIADVLDLECSLTLSPRALDVSPTYEELHPSAWHSQW